MKRLLEFLVTVIVLVGGGYLLVGKNVPVELIVTTVSGSISSVIGFWFGAHIKEKEMAQQKADGADPRGPTE